MSQPWRVLWMVLGGVVGGYVGYWIGDLAGWSTNADRPFHIGGGAGTSLWLGALPRSRSTGRLPGNRADRLGVSGA